MTTPDAVGVGEGSGFDWGQLLGTGVGLGLGMPMLGGIVGSLTNRIFSRDTGNTTRAADQLAERISDFTERGLYNAAGRVGKDVKPSFDLALGSLTNSAEARNAANAQTNLAGRTLSQAQNTMDSLAQNAQRTAGAQSRQAMDMARQQGVGSAGLASLKQGFGDVMNNTLGNLGAQQSQAAQAATQQAANMMANSSQILNQDLANRNDIYVKPFYAQSSGAGNTALGGIPGMSESISKDLVIDNPLSGLASGMGDMGVQFMNSAFTDQMAKRMKGAAGNWNNPYSSGGGGDRGAAWWGRGADTYGYKPGS